MASTNLMYRAGNVHIYNYIYQNCIRLIFFDKKKNIPARLRIIKKILYLSLIHKIFTSKMFLNIFLKVYKKVILIH